MTRKEFWERFVIILVTILIALAMVWINTYQRSVKYYKEGMDYLSKGKLLEAITSFETSAHAYTPWNNYVKSSMEKLWEIGERFEKEKEDPSYALIAYRSLRSSVYAIRSFYMPYKEWIPKCDKKIKYLVDKQRKYLEIKESRTPTPII